MAAVTVASVIVLFFLPLGVIINAVGEEAGQPYYEYLQFVQQYPRTVNRRSTLNDFTIHGLWPSNRSNNHVIFCGQNISVNTLLRQLSHQLQTDLSTSWPDVLNGINSRFWTHEYNKHGNCANHTFTTPQAYFKKADYLYRSFAGGQNLNGLFVRGGIRPGQQNDTMIYMNLVKNATGEFPRLWCSGNRLKEVVICYNKDATQVIDCPPLVRPNNCTGRILISTRRPPYGLTIRPPYGPTILVLSFSLPLGLIIFKYGPSYIKSKLA